MQLFKYILIDKESKTRIGYIEGESTEQLSERFLRSQVQNILSIEPFSPGSVKLLDKRKIFTFQGHREQVVLEGTIEQLSELDAYKELLEEHTITPSIVVEGVRNISTLQESFETMTLELAKRYARLQREKQIQEGAKAFFKKDLAPQEPEKKAIPVETATPTSTLLDREFHDILTSIREQTQEVRLERTYEEDIESIHTTIGVLLTKKSTTTKQKYDFLSYILRELAFIEDTMEDSNVRKKIKKLLQSCAKLLQRLQTIQAKQEVPKATKETSSHSFTPKEVPKEIQEDPALQAFKKYQDKKELVKSFLPDIEALKTHEVHGLEKATIDISSPNVILKELPVLSALLISLYMLFMLIGEGLLMGKKDIFLMISITDLFGSLFLSPISLKFILILIIFHLMLLSMQRKIFGSYSYIISFFSFLLISGSTILLFA